MKTGEIMKNGKTITCRFSFEQIRDVASAAGWLTRVAKLKGFTANYYAFRDLSRNSDEGGVSRQLKGECTAKEILDSYLGQPCEKLYLSGNYEGAPLGIGVDLAAFTVDMTVPEGKEEYFDLLSNLTRTVRLGRADKK